MQWSAADDLWGQANSLYDNYPYVQEAHVLLRRVKELRDDYESAVVLLERALQDVEAAGATDLLEEEIGGRRRLTSPPV